MASEWISVKDRLPEYNMWVLGFGDGAMMTIAFMNGEWKDLNDSPYPSLSPINVTHWQPLPEPPKGAA